MDTVLPPSTDLIHFGSLSYALAAASAQSNHGWSRLSLAVVADMTDVRQL